MTSMTSFIACRYVPLTGIGTQLCSLMLVLPRHCSWGMCNIYAVGDSRILDIASGGLHQYPFLPSFWSTLQCIE